MKIALLTPYYYPKIGGLEQYARQLALAIRSTKEIDVIIITSGTGRSTVIESVDDMTVYRLPIWFKLSNTPVNPLWPIYIWHILRKEKVSIVHAHSPVPSMADAGALAAGRRPFILTYHAATLRKQGSFAMKVITRLYEVLGTFTFWRANRVAAVSQYVKDQLPKHIQAKTVVVPNAVSKSSLIGRTQPGTLQARFIFIGSLDRSHAWKGLSEIITAMDYYRERYGNALHLDVIGDGSARSDYERQVTELGLTNYVQFHGALTGTAKDAILEKANALIAYPTTGNDAFPTVFLEAWALSVPVVAAAIGPIPSLIEHGENGYLVPPSQPDKLADILYSVVKDRVGRTAVASRAAKEVEDEFTWDHQASRMQTLFRELQA